MNSKGYLDGLISLFADAGKGKTAFSVYDGERVIDISYEEFVNDVLKSAGYFRARNMRRQHVALMGPNHYEWAVAFFAIAVSGNVPVLMNHALPKDILLWQCRKAEISVVCGFDDVIYSLQQHIDNVQWLSYGQMCEDASISIDEVYAPASDETVVMLFTSGTTGKSKIVEITSDNLCASVSNMIIEILREEGKPGLQSARDYLFLPLFHIGALRGLLQNLAQLRTVCFGRGAGYLFMDMAKLNPTHTAMVPAMLESLAKIFKNTPAEDRYKFIGSNLKWINAVGASMKFEIAQYLLRQNVRLQIVYGMTETTGDGSICFLDESHFGTIGRPNANTQFRIEDNEILIKSAGTMKGYYKDPQETEKVIRDGWIYTGDMGYCDKDGYYFITGRKKNVIILSNGENVNPEEIESKWSECEDILECLVYSDGKGICADVYTEHEDAAAHFIRQYNERIPMYRQVYKVHYSSTPLEKTASGKIKRKQNL